VLTIAGMPAGYDIAIEILYMRLHSEKDRKEPIAQELVDTGRELLRQHRFASKNDLEGYRIGAIAKCCITGEQVQRCQQHSAPHLRLP
jgi:hypothetical protein